MSRNFFKSNLVWPCLFFLFHWGIPATAAKPQYLRDCWNKQVKPLKSQSITYQYQEQSSTLEHSFEPWQQTKWASTGTVWVNTDLFMKNDTMTNLSSKRAYYSKIQLSKDDLLFLDYGDTDLFPVTNAKFQAQIVETGRYSPMTLIHYFFVHKVALSPESDKEFAIYRTKIHQTNVNIYIRKSDKLLAKITTLSDDELFGDVLTTFSYQDYQTIGSLHHPQNVEISKINGKLKDQVQIGAIFMVSSVENLLKRPEEYTMKADESVKPEIKVEKYSDHLYFIELNHTDDKVLVVEFETYLLVAEAPLNSANGELIIQEAKKIAPNKPIKYFVFGHYHPHYLGGIRPFIQEGASIICTEADQAYVRYIAAAPHTLNPDRLERQPKPVQFDSIKDKKTITDGKFDMEIYFIGNKSKHTNDYLIYYFPSEKLLFEDDLVWIKREGEITKANGRQAGLYQAVKDLGLDIKTIVQSWPVADYGVKTVIPFEDLERSVKQ